MKYLLECKSLEDLSLDPITIYFNIRNNAVGKQWTDVFIKNILQEDSLIPRDYPLDKVHIYKNNLDFLCERLNYSIKLINEEIEEYSQINECVTSTNITQDLMNNLHKHFELLIGQKWNVSKYFNQASERGKWAISELNSSIHAIELYKHDSIVLSIGYNCRNFKTNEWTTHNLFETLEKNKIDLESYKCWQNEVPWGSLQLFYNQTGKTHYDAYIDNDAVVDKDNISGWRYITGEVMLNLAFDFERQYVNDFDTKAKKYRDWLENMGYDLNDATQCYYGLIVADIDKQHIMPKYGNDIFEVHDKIMQYNDITKIGLCDDDYNQILSRDYSWYTWEDQYKANKEFYR